LDDGNETKIVECTGATVGNELGKLQRRGVLEKGRLQKGKCLLLGVSEPNPAAQKRVEGGGCLLH
jgi:hypothetical protein